MRKLVQGIIFSLVLGIVPALWNTDVLKYPQLWIMVIIGTLANVWQPAYKPFDRNAPAQDRGTALQILWSICLVQLAAIVEAVYVRYPESFYWNTISSIAFTLMILGLVIRTWAVYTLGAFFTWHVTTQTGQRVIRNGPYKWARHPSYTGAVLTYVFGPVFLHAWFTLIIALVAIPLAFARRIRIEESYLKQNLGSEYEKYCKEVRALIPGIW